ncbi:MAG: hypothetical protein M3Y68_16170 [Chloroflexota bacterium]|nr:hypothetical protein [Chloroflexota bacterium]
MAGLAFLTRYDSVLFFLPIALYVASKTPSIKYIFFAIAGAAVLPLVWLFISSSYYGDLLPTSFYVKTPRAGLGHVIFNGIYVASYLFYTGVIPVTAFIIVLLFSRRGRVAVFYEHFTRRWWLYLGLGLQILYGLTMATHHMMFSFRFFVPFIPSIAILLVDLLQQLSVTGKVDLAAGKPAYLFTGFLLCLALFQLFQNEYTYNHSVNGISLVGEYRALGVRDYIRFLQTLQQEAYEIERHWNSVAEERNRQPRILTYAAGMLPYTYRESYIYEKLVSYRHCHERYRQGLYADYIHIIAPRQGQVSQQLPKSVENYYLVSDYRIFFDGSMQELLVYYNPMPEEHNLSVGIYEPCELDKKAEH